MSEIVYLNGSLISCDQAKISVLDYGFLYGFGLFETIRAYRGHIFRLDRHLSRLSDSAGMLGIQVKDLELKSAITDTLKANELIDARIRITISIGEGETIPNLNKYQKPTVLILASEYQSYPDQVYERGFRATISSIRRNSQSPLSRIKSTNYLESILAKHEARVSGFDEALFLNEKGFLAEASMSNIFLVTDGILKTPRRESGILPGITREAILEIALQQGIRAIEGDILSDELFHAKEAFLTNSIIEVVPLTKVDKKAIGSGKAGVITKRLMVLYKELLCKEQQQL